MRNVLEGIHQSLSHFPRHLGQCLENLFLEMQPIHMASLLQVDYLSTPQDCEVVKDGTAFSVSRQMQGPRAATGTSVRGSWQRQTAGSASPTEAPRYPAGEFSNDREFNTVPCKSCKSLMSLKPGSATPFNGGDAVFPNASVSIAQRQSLKALGTVSHHGGRVRNRVSAECRRQKPMPRKQESPLLIGGF